MPSVAIHEKQIICSQNWAVSSALWVEQYRLTIWCRIMTDFQIRPHLLCIRTFLFFCASFELWLEKPTPSKSWVLGSVSMICQFGYRLNHVCTPDTARRRWFDYNGTGCKWPVPLNNSAVRSQCCSSQEVCSIRLYGAVVKSRAYVWLSFEYVA